MRNFYSWVLLLALLLSGTMLFVSCEKDSDSDNEDEEDITVVLKESDVRVNKADLSFKKKWLEEGDQYTLKVDEVDFSCKYDGVKLRTLRLENAEDVLDTVNYAPNVSLSAEVTSWKHGTNTLTVIGVFTDGHTDVEVEIAHPQVIVFNEVPCYALGGIMQMEISAFASNSEVFYKFLEQEGNTQEITFNANYSWLSSSGEYPDFYYQLSLTPTLVENKTNFDASIEVKEKRWMNYNDAPKDIYATSVPQTDFKHLEINAYVSVVVSGVHEGIELSESLVVSYKIKNLAI